jgi:hypothetical protein
MKHLILLLGSVLFLNVGHGQGIQKEVLKNEELTKKTTLQIGQEGHGGDPILSDFRQRGRFLLGYLQFNQPDLKNMIDLAKFEEAVLLTPIYLTNEPLKIVKDEILTAKTVPDSNSPTGFSIYVNEQRWLVFFNPSLKQKKEQAYSALRLVFHEFLLASLHADQVYDISHMLSATEDMYLEYNKGPDKVNQPVMHSNTVSMVLDKPIESEFIPFTWNAPFSPYYFSQSFPQVTKIKLEGEYKTLIEKQKLLLLKKYNKNWHTNFINKIGLQIESNLKNLTQFSVKEIKFKLQNASTYVGKLQVFGKCSLPGCIEDPDRMPNHVPHFVDDSNIKTAGLMLYKDVSPVSIVISSQSLDKFYVKKISSNSIRGELINVSNSTKYTPPGWQETEWVQGQLFKHHVRLAPQPIPAIATNIARQEWQQAYVKARETYMAKCEADREQMKQDFQGVYDLIYLQECEDSGKLVIKKNQQYHSFDGGPINRKGKPMWAEIKGFILYFEDKLNFHFIEESWD